MNKELTEKINDLIKEASLDLDDLYSPIKKSRKILQFKQDGQLVIDILVNIAAHFSLLQILEMSGKAKMIDDEKKYTLPRKERFEVVANVFRNKFDYLYQQHIKLLENKNE